MKSPRDVLTMSSTMQLPHGLLSSIYLLLQINSAGEVILEWEQSREDVILWVPVAPDVTKQDVALVLNPLSILLSIRSASSLAATHSPIHR
mgnify:FL=1|jgi:hypothetical protein